MNRIFFKITFLILLSLAVSFVVVVWTFVVSFEKYFENNHRAETDLATIFVQSYFEDLDGEQIRSKVGELRVRTGAPIRLIDISDQPEIMHEIQCPRHGKKACLHPMRGPWISVHLDKTGQVLRLGPEREDLPLHRKKIPLMLFWIVLIVCVTGYVTTKPLVKRLKTLERAVQQMGRGNLDARVPVGSSDAFGSLEKHFNTMASDLSEILNGQRDFLHAVAHEIRAPMARVQVALEILSTSENPADQERRKKEIEEELADINTLVTAFLDYYRFDSQRVELDKISFNVEKRLEKIIEKPEFRSSEVVVEYLIDDGAREFYADLQAFELAVFHILSNAFRFAQGNVTISTKEEVSILILEISDDGPGIPPEDRKNMLAPLARVEKSRSRRSGGIGLGLALVKAIVKAHQGQIEIDESSSGGTLVRTKWPSESLNIQEKIR